MTDKISNYKLLDSNKYTYIDKVIDVNDLFLQIENNYK